MDVLWRLAVLIGNAQYWYFRFFFTFLDIYFSRCNVYLLTPPPFVMTQINEIKRNRLPNFFYAFSMSTANLHSSLKGYQPDISDSEFTYFLKYVFLCVHQITIWDEKFNIFWRWHWQNYRSECTKTACRVNFFLGKGIALSPYRFLGG